MNVSDEVFAPIRKLALAWFCLALAALGVSSLPAALIAVPLPHFLGQGAGLYGPAAALHAMLATPVWLLGMLAGLLTLASSRAGVSAWGAWWLALAGVAALMIAPWFGGKVIPGYAFLLLDNPLFLGGAGTFGLAVGVVAIRALPAVRRFAGGQPEMRALAWATPALVATLMLTLAAVARTDLIDGLVAPLQGIGRLLQFVYVFLLLAAWSALDSGMDLDKTERRRGLHVIHGLAALPLLGGIVLMLALPADSREYALGFDWLMRWASWPAAALYALLLLVKRVARLPQQPLNTEQKGLVLSILLFAAGCIELVLQYDSLSGSSQAYGVMGALTLACLLWWRRLTSDRDVSEARQVRLSLVAIVYGAGVLLFVSAARLASALLQAGTSAHVAVMMMANAGGLVAIAASAGYAVVGLGAVLGKYGPQDKRRRDRRPWAIALTLILVIGGGWLLELLPASSPAVFSPRQHAAEKIRADIAIRFEQGVIMLHAKQYEHALTAFHRVLQLDPKMPEAHVNAGYALLGMKRYKAARDFFESATQLRPYQVNAYYGLAVALEGMGDLPGALGAMETFMHLSKADDPFRRKAEAAIWEWRSTLDGSKLEQRSNAK